MPETRREDLRSKNEPESRMEEDADEGGTEQRVNNSNYVMPSYRAKD